MEALKLCNLTWSPLKHFFHSHAFRRTPPVLVLRACSSSTAAADTRAAGRGRRSSESSSTTSTSDRDAIRAIRLKKVRASSVSCNGDVLLRFLLIAVFHVCVCVWWGIWVEAEFEVEFWIWKFCVVCFFVELQCRIENWLPCRVVVNFVINLSLY